MVVNATFLPALSPAEVTVAVYCVPYLSCLAGIQVVPSGRRPPSTVAPVASVSVTDAFAPGAACRASSVAVETPVAPSAGAVRVAVGRAADAEAEGPPALALLSLHLGFSSALQAERAISPA